MIASPDGRAVTEGDEWRGGPPADVVARRQLRRRQLRRRRLLALGGLLSVVVAIVALAAGGGHGETRTSEANRVADKAPPARAEVHSDWVAHPGPVPILEYHVLGPPPADAPYPELYVTRPDFHREMNWLDRNGYEGVTLDQVEQAWFHGGTLPRKPVVISFDDGYRPQFTYAMPELRRHGWPGVLNLKAEGSDLYPSNVRAMIGAGWELASHTIHHLDLTTLDPEQLREEVSGSRAVLRRRYGVAVDNFCYPSGRYDETVIAALKAAGYVGAMTEVPGEASRGVPYELGRYEVLGSSGVAGVAADLGGS
jgi:peptidoglycan/xylan/chitin deacetylase (PgdA/CDA1 family)